jgi:mevalonate kinase
MTQLVHQLSSALLAQSSSDIAHVVRQLQGHLTALGIVPEPVQALTTAIEALGWSGKLCGAGSVSGAGGGFFWLLADEDPQSVCDAFGYPYWSLAQLMGEMA